MAPITGVRTTGNITANQRIIDMRDRIFLLEPDVAPLTSLMSKLTKLKSGNPKFEWLEDALLRSYVVESGGLTAVATTLNLSSGHGANVIAGHIMVNARTNEMVLVSAAPTVDAVPITRGYGSVAAAAGLDGDEWFITGFAALEDDTVSPLVSSNKNPKSNFLQFFKKSFGATDIEINSDLYGGNDMTYQGKKAGIEFLREVEKAFLVGYPKLDTSGASTRWVTGGLLSFIQSNVTDLGGFMTEGSLEDTLRQAFRYGTTKKLAISAPQPLSTIAMFAQSRTRIVDRTKTFGIAVTEYVSPHGQIALIKDNVLEGSTGFGGMVFILDMENIVYRYLNNMDIQIVENIQANDRTAKISEYRGVIGLQVMMEQTHALAKNINFT